MTEIHETETQESSSSVKSYPKLSQLHTAFREHLDDRYIYEILNRDGDIVNYRIPNKKTRVGGRTAISFALSRRNIKIFNHLLNQGADITAKYSNDGSTILHQLVEDKYRKHIDNWELKGKIDDPFIDSTLSSHIQFNIQVNPLNEHGITHFHAACMSNNTKAVEFFLNTVGVSVDEAVKTDSPVFPGYMPLHFASRFCALKTAEILLENGASVHAKDARGMTAMHLLIERNLKIVSSSTLDKRGVGAAANLSADLTINEKIVNLLLENDTSTTSCDDFGFSKFHVACCMRDDKALLARRFLKHVADVDLPIHKNSPVAPGCTALHLAALFSVDTVELLMSRGANIQAEDVNGITPLDICLEGYRVEDLRAILECQTTYNEVLLSDGKTKLLDLLLAMKSSSNFVTFSKQLADVDTAIASDSPLWPNYTALHLAILLYSKTKSLCAKRTYFQVMRECLNRGANVDEALRFAFRLKEIDAVNLLFQYHKMTINKPVDEEDEWSQLHIACVAVNETSVEKLILKGANVNAKVKSSFSMQNFNIASGSTALHITVIIGCAPIVNFLLKHGVDPYAKDDEGLTAIHRSFTTNSQPAIGQLLLSAPNLKDCEVNGLSHLHVACFFNCIPAVKKLLHAGANVNATIDNKIVPEYKGFTPLRMAIRRGHWEITKLLVQQGAETPSDILMEVLKDKYASYQKPFISIVKRDRINLEGMSLLHIACKKVDVRLVKSELARDGVDVNGKMKGGHTPLHLLMMEANNFMHNHQRQIDIDAILKLLLDNGADVSTINDNMQTPLNMADKLFYIYMDQPSNSPCGLRVDTMLKSIRDFNINPIDADGVSHFHIACSWNSVNVVEEFLKAGVEVNHTTDHFADQFAGCTALHLTLSSQTKNFTGVASQLETVELLLKYGANVAAEDARGNIPLHTAAKYGPPREKLFEMIIRAGANINAKNIYGETPLEILLKSKDVTAEEIGFFLERGCRVNDYNPVNLKGYIPMTFSTRHHESVQKLAFDAMIAAPSIGELDDTGCTAIHNVVSTGSPIITEDDYTDLIERLIKLGCDIDYQDNLGKTALHVAAQFQNDRAITGLLSAGADINVVDAKGKPAFAYSLEPCKVFDEYREGRNEIIKRTFAVHVHKMQLGKLDVSPTNKNVQISVVKRKSFDANMSEKFYKEIETMKDVKIGCSRSLFLHDFMSETGAVIDYPSMTYLEREAVDDFFESSRAHLTSKFSELSYLVRLQYRKALARFSLIDTAKVSLNDLSGFLLPDPCSEAIFVYLKNSELKSLIEASL